MAACAPAGTGNLPAATYSSAGTAKIACDGVTDGLTLTVGPDATIGTEAGPVSGHAIDIDGSNDARHLFRGGGGGTDSPGDKDITVVNSGRIYSSGSARGIEIFRDGAGSAKVEHKAGAGITAKGSITRGISVHHNGKRGATSKGVHVVSAGDIEVSGSACRTNSECFGIIATAGIFAAEPLTTNPITVEVTGAITVNASNPQNNFGIGVYLNQFSSGKVTFTNSGTIKATNSGLVAFIRHTSPVAVTNSGTIEAGGGGISITTITVQGHEKKGDTTVTATEDSMISSEYAGIFVYHRDGTGNIAVTHGGTLRAGTGERIGNSPASGIYARHAGTGNITVTATRDSVITTDLEDGIWVRITDSDSKGTVAVVNSGSIDANRHGIDARNSGTGALTVTVSEGATVEASRDGIYVDGAKADAAGMRAQTVEVHGTVAGGRRNSAGVHMVKGGTVVIGPRAHVSAASGVAVKANAEGDMTVILVEDSDGFTGTVDGDIRNAAETVFRLRDASGMETALTVGDAVKSAGETKGVYRAVRTSVLEEAMEDGSKVGYKLTGAEERQYHARARVYEALPSVLVDLNAPAPRLRRGASGGNSAWAAFDAGEGERQAAVSTTSKGMAGRALAWDFTRWGVASGLDFPAEEDLTVGVSAHHRRGKATVKHGGTVKASGTGVGASVTYGSADAVYVRGWFSYSKFSGIELVSRDDIPGSGNLSKSDVSGSGNAIGVEAGMRTELEGMTLTPRGGLVFSSVDINGFSDLEGVAGSGKVSGSGKSFKARLGVTADIGEVAAGAAVYASLDAEHDFSAKRDVTASGTKLTSKPKATWGRLGLGGEISLSDDGGTMLSGEAYYATAGGGNSDFGGGLTLGFRF